MKIKFIFLSLIFFSVSIFFGCSSDSSNNEKKEEKKEEIPVVIPTRLTTKSPQKAAFFSEISAGGNVTFGNDNFTITEQGVAWGKMTNPSITDNKSIANTTSEDFLLTISDLEASTTYYFRAYATAGSVTIYGGQKEITTDSEPVTGVNAFLPIAGAGKSWVLQPKFTNEFDYTDGKTSTEFTDNWQDHFFNGWTGPKKSGTATTSTIYTTENSSVEGGELVYRATINGNNVHTGCISSKEKVGYPLYMETRVKISESSLATAVWLLSDDSTQEIDNLEAYGNKSNTYFSQRLHLSHHTFIRNPFEDYQPTGNDTWYADGNGTFWADDYHDYGVLWLDPFTLKYYVDGELVRETPTNQIDPLDLTGGTGLNKDMHLIISAAAQPWRETTTPPQVGNYVTDPSVISESRSTARIDYIRTYKPE